MGEQPVLVSRRRNDTPEHVVVSNYNRIPDDQFIDKTVVINCVGTATGNTAVLHKANIGIPLHCAVQARNAGVKRFIHISSFSVYGELDFIDRYSALAPLSDYGASKLQADQKLLALQTREFSVCILRLPMLYGFGDSKLEKLMKFWRKIRFLPVPAQDVLRSIISYQMAAELVNRMATTNVCGIFCAADVKPFSYRGASQSLAGSTNNTFRTIKAPRILDTSLAKAVPALHAKLYKSSYLRPEANYAQSLGLQSTLYSDLALMACSD